MNLQPLKDTIYNWVTSRVDSSVTVYWKEQGAPRPQRPSLSLKLVVPATKLYRDDLRYQESDSTFRLNGPRTMLVSFNSYGAEALDIMTGLQDYVDDPDGVELLAEGGVSIVEQGQVQNLTELLEANFETRAQMDMTFGYTAENATGVVQIDKISINDVDIPSS